MTSPKRSISGWSKQGVDVYDRRRRTMGNVTVAVFDDTCGNLIQMVQNN